MLALKHLVRHLSKTGTPKDQDVVVIDSESGGPIYRVPLGVALDGLSAMDAMVGRKAPANDNPDPESGVAA